MSLYPSMNTVNVLKSIKYAWGKGKTQDPEEYIILIRWGNYGILDSS